jgi:serine phosphatase RsbU (regulator of sigma subunit)
LNGQNSKSVDSLFSLLQSSGLHDTSRIIALNDLARKLMNVNPDTAIILSNQALQYSQSLFEKENNFSSAQYVRDKLQAVSYNNLGVFNWLKGNYPVAFDYYFKALTIRQSLNDKTGTAQSLSNIGSIYWSQGNYSKALDYNFKAMLIAQEIGDKQFYANTLGNIGVIYASQKNHSKALECYFEVVKIKEAARNKKDILNLYGNIGNAFVEQKKFIDAIYYYSKVLTLATEEDNKLYMASTLVNLGEAYTRLKNYPLALDYYFKALKLFEKIDNQSGIAASLGNIGTIYSLTGKYKDAELFLQKSITISHTIGSLEHIREFEKVLSHVYEQTRQPAKAFEHYKKYTAAKDSLFNEQNTQKIVQSEMNYEFEKKQVIEEARHKSELEKQTAVAEEKHRKQNVIIFSAIAGLLLVIGFAAFIFRTLHITRQQKHIIELKNKEIEEKNRDITASITYTKRIQRAMLPHRRDILAAFPQSFVLFKPKDIVSGDFYFFHNKKDTNTLFLAAADCTGHGVPGAFMSMIGAEKLKDAVIQSNDTSEILNLLNKGIKASLRQSENSDSTRDGMDIALVRIDKPDDDSQPVTLYYAGANRPIWIIRKGQQMIEEIKATKKGIAGFTDDEQQYETHKVELQPNDSFYIFTDGYADLFGEAGKKLMIKRVKEILLRIQDKPMKEQGKFLENYASKWQGDKEQIDDILMIGIRI